MRKNERLYDVFKRRGYDMVVLSQPENVLHATGMVTLPNIYAVGFFNWSLPLATFIADLRNDKELLIIADSVAGDVKKYAFTKEVRTFHPYDLSVEMHPANEYEKAVREAVYELGGGARIAVEPSLTMAAQRAIKAVLPDAELIDASEAIFESKAIKAPWEIERMKKAASVVDAAFIKLNELSHSAGREELAMWRDIFGAMVDDAGEHVQISGELVTGPRSFDSSYPGGPAHRVTEAGDVGIMDMSARFDGYWCDCCNVVSFGKKNDTQRRLFDVIYNAYEYMRKALKPGATAAEVYRASERAYKEAGYECPHYIGHSIGTGLNDLPKIIPCDNRPIEAGMCFSMEPGIYQEHMGLRIEKMLLVTPEGNEEFNRFSWGVYEWD